MMRIVRDASEWRRFTASVVALCLFALVPLAQASPPDPTWIAGIYDNGDYDDVVIAVTSSAVTVETRWVVVTDPRRVVVAFLSARSESSAPATPRAAPQTRAPPSA